MFKRVTIDISHSAHLGPSCKFLEILPDLISREYKINIILNDWSKKHKKSGLKFDRKKNEYETGGSKFLVDYNTHPNDIFENIIMPTFPQINYIQYKKNLFGELAHHFIHCFSPLYFSEYHFIPYFSNKKYKDNFHRIQIDLLLKETNLKTIFNYLMFFVNTYINLRFKIFSKSKGFRYKLNDSFNNQKVKNFIAKARKESEKYVLISADWDDNRKYVKLEDRLRGIDYEKYEFMSMVNYVKALDKYATEGKIKFLLVNKKAQDWQKVIKSQFLDLREFEKLGFTLAQTLYISQELSSMTINWANTFNIWITNCSKMLHLTWGGQKDTAKWTRNRLHKENVEEALKLIEVI